ncbi:MAG: hypothetical protein ACI8RZ_007061 [Myxococcota bacterium]|jgi:hypothetical protein
MGNLSRSSKVIHLQAAGVTASLNGATKALRPGNDDVPDFNQTFAVVFNSTVAGSTTPSLTVKLQTSWDNANWVDVVAATAMTADGSAMEYKAIAAVHLGPFVRAAAVITGTLTYTGNVTLVSNAHFTVATVA